eukprot:385699-Pelagomonas_calceolata.AAC.1
MHMYMHTLLWVHAYHTTTVHVFQWVAVHAPQGAGDKKEVRSRRDELANAARSEAHKLQRIEDTLAALLALPESAELCHRVFGRKRLYASDVPAVLGVAGDFVAEVLDKEKGAEVTDYNIFRQHAAKYEVRMFSLMLSSWMGVLTSTMSEGLSPRTTASSGSQVRAAKVVTIMSVIMDVCQRSSSEST